MPVGCLLRSVVSFILLCAASVSAQTATPPLLPPGGGPTAGSNYQVPARSRVAMLAVEHARDEIPPIPLIDKGRRVGSIYDPFRLAILDVRQGTRTGAPVPNYADPNQVLALRATVVVAFPFACGGKTIDPQDIQVQSPYNWAPGQGPQQVGPAVRGSEIRTLLPGVGMSAGALAVQVARFSLNWAEGVKISYAPSACLGKTNQAVIGFRDGRFTPRVAHSVKTAEMPAGVSASSPVTVRVRGMVDIDGRLRFPEMFEGPPQLSASAQAIAEQWRFVPLQRKGAPIPTEMDFRITFKSTR